jgi:hypothetical protein
MVCPGEEARHGHFPKRFRQPQLAKKRDSTGLPWSFARDAPRPIYDSANVRCFSAYSALIVEMGSRRPSSRNQPPPLYPSYRVVVRPREPSRRRDFIWQIVRSKSDGATVMESASGSFKSMEDAFTQGILALARYNSRNGPPAAFEQPSR